MNRSWAVMVAMIITAVQMIYILRSISFHSSDGVCSCDLLFMIDDWWPIESALSTSNGLNRSCLTTIWTISPQISFLHHEIIQHRDWLRWNHNTNKASPGSYTPFSDSLWKLRDKEHESLSQLGNSTSLTTFLILHTWNLNSAFSLDRFLTWDALEIGAIDDSDDRGSTTGDWMLIER